MPMRGTNPDRHGPPGMTTRAYSLPLALCTAALLAACGSAPKQQQAAEAAAEIPAAQAAAPTEMPEWQRLRARHFDCATDKANELMRGSASSPDVARQALRACDDRLSAMRTAFRTYLEAQMVSSHGKAGARRAADQLARDTERKVQTYLEQSVVYTRYQAKVR